MTATVLIHILTAAIEQNGGKDLEVNIYLSNEGTTIHSNLVSTKTEKIAGETIITLMDRGGLERTAKSEVEKHAQVQ